MSLIENKKFIFLVFVLFYFIKLAINYYKFNKYL
jgi:hypothetical protein